AARGKIPPVGLSALEATLNAPTLTKLAVKTILEEAGVLGASLHIKDGFELTLAEDCQSEETALRRATNIRRESGPELAKVLTAALGTTVEMLDDQSNNPDATPGGDTRGPVAGGRGPGYGPVPPAGPRVGALGGGGPRPGG